MTRVALITGVAGGIGSATARIFSSAGWLVVGVDRGKGESVSGVDRYVSADVAQSDALERIFLDLSVQEGRLDTLINNAAVQVCKPVLETTTEEWDATMATNVRAVFLSARYAYPLLRESKGSIVNISSVHALATSVGIAAYAASKGAVVALTRAMALEFGTDGIRVNALLPGAVDTGMLRAGFEREYAAGSGAEQSLEVLSHKHVMGRIGRPDEIGEAALFLADPARSAFITGQSLVVDGGASARLSTE